MIDALIIAALLVCAALAIRSTQILTASIWLGAASAVLSLWLYTMGAPAIAVIELSVGAGLVTVLLVFVIGVTGQATRQERALLPTPLSWALVISSLLLLAGSVLPLTEIRAPFVATDMTTVLWQDRGLDVLLQIVLIFAGALGVLGLMSGEQTSASTPGLAQVLESDAAPSPPSPSPVDEMLPSAAEKSFEVAPHAPPEEVHP